MSNYLKDVNSNIFNNPVTLKVQSTFDKMKINSVDHELSIPQMVRRAKKTTGKTLLNIDNLFEEEHHPKKRINAIMGYLKKHKKSSLLDFKRLKFLRPFIKNVNKKESIMKHQEMVIENKRKIILNIDEKEKNKKKFNLNKLTNQGDKIRELIVPKLDTYDLTKRTTRDNTAFSSFRHEIVISDRLRNESIDKIPNLKICPSLNEKNVQSRRRNFPSLNEKTKKLNTKDNVIINKSLKQIKNLSNKPKKYNNLITEEDIIPPIKIERFPFIYDESFNKIQAIYRKNKGFLSLKDKVMEFDKFLNLNEKTVFNLRHILFNKFQCEDLKEDKSHLDDPFLKRSPSLLSNSENKINRIIRKTKISKTNILDKIEKWKLDHTSDQSLLNKKSNLK